MKKWMLRMTITLNNKNQMNKSRQGGKKKRKVKVLFILESEREAGQENMWSRSK